MTDMARISAWARRIPATWSARPLLWALVAGNVAAAFTGFGKDLVIAAYLGTSAAADAYANTYYLVDTVAVSTLGAAVGIGAASAFGISVRTASSREHCRTVRRGLGWTVGVSLAATGMLALGRPVLVSWLSASAESLAEMNRIYVGLLAMACLYPLYSVLAGALQAEDRFLLTAFAPVCINLAVVGAAGWLIWHGLPPSAGGGSLAWAYSAGTAGIALAALQAWSRRGRRWLRALKSGPSAAPSPEAAGLETDGLERIGAGQIPSASARESGASLRIGMRAAAGYAVYLT
ncbi:MAG: hypothetical protein K6T30_01530, partial [Alicyclobacillus sp.]|nr:hypothetical protein [Alicyclobacillus sp.]